MELQRRVETNNIDLSKLIIVQFLLCISTGSGAITIGRFMLSSVRISRYDALVKAGEHSIR